MKKRYIKRTVAMVLALILSMSTMVMSAGAASSVSGTLGNYRATGSVSMGSVGATAQTAFGTGAQYVSAYVVLYYKWGTKSYCSHAETAHEGVSAMAYVERQQFGAELFGATGSHRIEYDAYSWNPAQTQVGTILYGAKLI